MDKEHAKFLLKSFRPDGADAADPEFSEALALATEDRELGEWLARERAFDAAFSEALGTLPLPQSLRNEILGSLAAERGDYPQADDTLDASFIGAIASIQPPAALRSEVLAAMRRSATPTAQTITAPPVARIWKRIAIPLAAAAGIALALVVTREKPASHAVANGPLPVDVVQAGFIRAYESPIFSLDTKQEDQRQLVEHLKARSLPCPGCLPPGLAKVKGIGCRELVIDGKRGSLVCFDERENGVVHLVIFRRQDISGILPQRDHPDLAQNGHWAVARWEDEKNVFLLIGNTEVDKLATLF